MTMNQKTKASDHPRPPMDDFDYDNETIGDVFSGLNDRRSMNMQEMEDPEDYDDDELDDMGIFL